MDAVWTALLDHLESRGDYFRIFDRYRIRPDAWLKIEALSVLHSLVGSSIRDVRPDRQGADLWLTSGAGEYWVAVRGLITSYAGGGRDAPQTLMSVEGIAREMDKLRGLSTLGGGHAALLLAAFPFGPQPRERDEWQATMLRFEAKGFDLAGRRTIPLGTDRESRVYLFA